MPDSASSGRGPLPDGVVTKVAAGTVAEVTTRFRQILDAKGVTVFAVIDQAAAARAAGLNLRDTVLVIFGNPAAGTPVMAAAPLAALDLPLKLLIWDDTATTRIAYYSPESITERHRLHPETAAALSVIHPLTDTLTAP
ncbi:DUF302 domain-containing protein [Kribbella sp. NBC_01510]|uniref:DUF302 domain-containing protein n=1 Tax=Kribbella sp. NBC_01510 TaxID=2903581 RepID=UPI00386AA375